MRMSSSAASRVSACSCTSPPSPSTRRRSHAPVISGSPDHDRTITDSRFDIQLLGCAWDDAKLVGFAYAFEQIANAARRSHATTTVPALRYEAGK